MSEDCALSKSAASAGTVAPGAGALLRAAREATGLHIAALAVSLRVPVRKIEALEADRWNELPDPAFTRALASSACRALRADPAPILALLPPAPATRLLETSALRGSTMSGASPSISAGWLGSLANVPVLSVLALLAAALAVYLWPATGGFDGWVAPATSMPAAPGAATALTTPGTSITPVPSTANAVSNGANLLVPPPVTDSGVVAAVPVGASATPGEAAPGSAAASAAPVPPFDPIMTFTAKSVSWVEVLDARQSVVLRRILNTGESATVGGALPLAVVIGRADAIDVTVRGQSFDVLARAKDNVARFEVK